jgi:RNA polymerase sigma-70 factor, ECF subfamily
MDIYRRYGPALCRKCERLLGNKDDAEDVVQGLFVDLLKKGEVEASLPYLYRAVTNRCLNLIRNRKKRQKLLERNTKEQTLPVRTLLEDEVVGFELLSRLVAKLDKRSSEILVYRYVDDFSQEEIAEAMNLSRKTVGKRLQKISREAKKLAAAEKGGSR